MKLVSKYETVITETVLNYEYSGISEFQTHRDELSKDGIYVHLSHPCNNGKFIATYIASEEVVVNGED